MKQLGKYYIAASRVKCIVCRHHSCSQRLGLTRIEYAELFTPLNGTLSPRGNISTWQSYYLTWPEYYEKAIENFTAKAKLKSLNILTTNTDGKTDFVSSTAGYKHPVYPVQWHPEKALFEQK